MNWPELFEFCKLFFGTLIVIAAVCFLLARIIGLIMEMID